MTAAYRHLLTRLDGGRYAAGITALWALERAYLEARKSASPGHRDYQEFIEHWTTAEFTNYVAGLETAASRSCLPRGRPDQEGLLGDRLLGR